MRTLRKIVRMYLYLEVIPLSPVYCRAITNTADYLPQEPTTIPRTQMLVLGMTSMGSTFTSVRSLRYVIYPVQVGLAFVLVRQMYTEYKIPPVGSVLQT